MADLILLFISFEINFFCNLIFIENHKSDLSLHHAYNLIDRVDFILARCIMPIMKVSSPDIT